MHVGAKVLLIEQDITVLVAVAFLLVCLAAVICAHHDVQFVAVGLDDGGGADLSCNGSVPGMKARVNAGIWRWDGLVVFVIFDIVLLAIQRLGRELGDSFGGGEEESCQADDVGCPDHGLDVEHRPAIGGHANEL